MGPVVGALPLIELKLMLVAVVEVTVTVPPVPKLPPLVPVPFVAVINVPVGIPVTPVRPVIVPFHEPLPWPAMLPTTGEPEIAVGQKITLLENGIFGAAGSIGMTDKFTLKVWGVSVVLVNDRLGFIVAALEITEVTFVTGFVMVQT